MCTVRVDHKRLAFTLVELLVATAIIAVLIALLLPAIQMAREASRRASCANNLRQVGLAVLNYENVQRAGPVGVSGYGQFGMSWWVQTLPFLEQALLFDQLDSSGMFTGMVSLNPINARAVDGVQIPSLSCPSSPIEPMFPVGTVSVQMPSYVGIAGATNDGGFPETRVAPCCVSDGVSGQISAGGILVPNRSVFFSEVTDGLSNTILVGECSDYVHNAEGSMSRIDGGLTPGWIAGTPETKTPPNYAAYPGKPRPSYNITTIRYAPNMRDYNQPGVRNDGGPNNPLVSAHPNGVHVGLLDGSVRFLAQTIDISTLKSLATRDDGVVVVSP